MFGSGRRKLVDNAAMNDANDVILLWRQSSLHWSAVEKLGSAYLRPILTVLGNLTPKCGRPSFGTPKGTSLRDCA